MNCQSLESNLGFLDIRTCYKKIAFDFCNNYYRIWDTNFPMIKDVYNNNPKITYFDRNFKNINTWSNYINNYQGVNKFEHINFSGTAHVLDRSNILIHVTGTITVNNSIYWRKYSETIIIRKNIWDKWYVTNSIFKLI